MPPAPSLLRDRRMLAIFAITLMAVLGVSSVTPAFPEVRRALGVSETEVGLLVTVFTLPGVFLTALLGVVADRWGRRRILLPALALFGLAGGACAFAADFQVLLALRFVQGIGAAPLGALNLTLIGDYFQDRERAAAMGWNASILSVGTASYPALGGLLALAGWRAPFFLPLLALPVAGFVAFAAPEIPREGGQRLGGYLRGVLRALRDAKVLGLFGVSLATFILLYGAVLTYLPLLISDRFGGSSAMIGAVMAASSVVTAVTSSRLGHLSARFRPETLVVAGFVAYTLALLAVPFVPGLALLFLPAAVFGLGQGLNLPSTLTLITDLAPEAQRGAVLSLNGMILRLGQTLGPLVMGLAFGLGGFDAVYVGGAGLGLFSILGLLLLFRHTGGASPAAP